ncbi:MAG TPA: T9SS type A sorting domain-containing protein, partial [Bacteroidales bacterium]|nr:T9SS type A sorting domain-containing protein [Bacteroidales bacterium]
SYTFDSSIKIVNIIFSKDGSPQSTNITNVVKSTCYALDAYVSENTFSVKTVDCPAPSYTVSVSANPMEGGTVTGGGSYESGTSCTVTAIAYGGYVFTGWTENGSVVFTDSVYEFIVEKDRTLTANFNLTTDLKDLSRYNINTYVTQRKIIIENATGWDIKVIDVTGKVVYINKVSSNREEVPILVPGIYIIKMYRNEDVGSQKIVVR